MVQAFHIADRAILGSEKDIFEPLYGIKPDIIAPGKNQFYNEKELEEQVRMPNTNPGDPHE